MAITPQTNLKLLKLDLEIDNKNQLTFSSLLAQTTYFEGLTGLSEDDFTYQRKDNIIRFPAHIDTILEYNYVMYQNENYGNKYFYAFIEDMKYINDGMTEIKIKTDVFQTWQFDFIFKKSFVEREHVSDDTEGNHTIPENLEYGEYIQNAIYKWNTQDYMFLIQVGEFYHNQQKPIATNVGGIPMAGGFYLCDTFSEVANILDYYGIAGVSQDNIYNIYIVPKILLTDITTDSYKVWLGCSALNGTWSFAKLTTLDGYTPRNKKLLTFPYCGLLLSNNSGSGNTLRFEDFSTSDCEFEIKGVATIGTSIKCSPRYYKKHGQGGYEEEGIIGGKFPALGWSQDSYRNWLSQNSINVGLGVVSGIAEVAFGNPAGGLNTLASTLAQVTQAQMMPNSSKGNLNAGDVQTATLQNTFVAYSLSIKQEYAKIIDKYFDMMGYKINDLKIPNLNTRTNWNYVKTQIANIVGDIPQKDLEELKTMFNQGITLWHNPLTFLDYSQSNSVI